MKRVYLILLAALCSARALFGGKEEDLATFKETGRVWFGDLSGFDLTAIVEELQKREPTVKITLYGTNLQNSNLSSANLTDADLHRAKLQNANISEANLTRTQLGYAKLENTNMQGTVLTDAQLLHAQFKKTKLDIDAIPEIERLLKEQKRKKDLDLFKRTGHAFFADLSNLDLTSIIKDLRKKDPAIKISFNYANLQGSNLSHTDLTDADLHGAQLQNANLSYANLTNADLSFAEMENTNLSHANLTRAKLEYAQLKNTILTKTDLTDTHFLKARFKKPRLEVDAIQHIEKLLKDQKQQDEIRFLAWKQKRDLDLEQAALKKQLLVQKTTAVHQVPQLARNTWFGFTFSNWKTFLPKSTDWKTVALTFKKLFRK